MIDKNYDRILNKISKSSGIEKEELERRIEAKRAKLSGLISKDGAAQIIAAELGINFDNETLKINELLPGMRKVNTLGKVINLSSVRTFVRNNKEGKVVNLTLADDTSNVKVVLWDVNHIELIEKKSITEGKVVEILNASMRGNELHLGSFSELKNSKEVLGEVKTHKIVSNKRISDFRVPDSVGVRAFIVQIFEPRFFNVCPECSKKLVSEAEGFVCGEHGSVAPEKRAVINIIIDDGTESMRSVLFHESIHALGLTELENSDALLKQKHDILGKEMFFSGDVRNNKFFNNPEFVIGGVVEVNLDDLIKNLEER